MRAPIECHACGMSYRIPDALFERRFAGKLTRIRCRGCGESVEVDGTDTADERPLDPVPSSKNDAPTVPPPRRAEAVRNSPPPAAPAEPVAGPRLSGAPRPSTAPRPSAAPPHLAPLAAAPIPVDLAAARQARDSRRPAPRAPLAPPRPIAKAAPPASFASLRALEVPIRPVAALASSGAAATALAAAPSAPPPASVMLPSLSEAVPEAAPLAPPVASGSAGEVSAFEPLGAVEPAESAAAGARFGPPAMFASESPSVHDSDAAAALELLHAPPDQAARTRATSGVARKAAWALGLCALGALALGGLRVAGLLAHRAPESAAAVRATTEQAVLVAPSAPRGAALEAPTPPATAEPATAPVEEPRDEAVAASAEPSSGPVPVQAPAAEPSAASPSASLPAVAEPSAAPPAASPPAAAEPSGVSELTESHHDARALKGVLAWGLRMAEGCHKGGRVGGTARIVVTFAPSGRVSETHIEDGPIARAPVGGCILAYMRSLMIPPYDGDSFTVVRELTLL